MVADKIDQKSEGPYMRTCFDKGSKQVAEVLSQEETMEFEGRKLVESYLVVAVVMVVVVQLGRNRTGTNAVGEGSLECDVAAANERAPNHNRD